VKPAGIAIEKVNNVQPFDPLANRAGAVVEVLPKERPGPAPPGGVHWLLSSVDQWNHHVASTQRSDDRADCRGLGVEVVTCQDGDNVLGGFGEAGDNSPERALAWELVGHEFEAESDEGLPITSNAEDFLGAGIDECRYRNIDQWATIDLDECFVTAHTR
jgi:hypothetical protein